MTNKMTKSDREGIEKAARKVDDARATLENVLYEAEGWDTSDLDEIHTELEGLEVRLTRIAEGK